MIKALKLLLFVGLIQIFFAFSSVAILLFLQMVQDVNSRSVLFYAVAAASSVAALCVLLMLLALGIDFYGKHFTTQTNTRITLVLVAVGLSFCSVATYAYYVSPVDITDNFLMEFDHFDADFFRRFIYSARLEFSLIGLFALIMSAIKIYQKNISLKNK